MELANALYFPYINFRDIGWLKTAALYYTKLFRIVPPHGAEGDSEDVRSLIENLGFIENIDRPDEAELIELEFVEEMRKQYVVPQLLPRMFTERASIRSIGFPMRLHASKFTYGTLATLAELGLAEDYRRLKNNRQWVRIDRRAAAIYMTMLAERMAERRGIPAVTDDPLFQKWLTYFGFESEIDQQRRREHRLPFLVIRTAVPSRIADVPIKKLAEFRRIHDAERIRFFAAIESMSRDVARIQDSQAIEECIEQHRSVVADGVNELRKSLQGVGIAAAAGLVGVSLPPLIAQLVPNPTGLILGGGLSLALGLNALSFYNQHCRLRGNSPWTYVLSLSRLNARTFVQRASQGELLI